MGLLERHGEGASKVRAKVVTQRTKAIMRPEIRAIVEPGTTIYTDALKSYHGLAEDYIHEVIDHSEAYVRDRVIHTNAIENFWSLLKRVLYGTHHSAQPFHLYRYLEEDVFRFNNRELDSDGLFVRLAGGVDGRRVTYSELTGKTAPGMAPA
jgi:transposase-like protein